MTDIVRTETWEHAGGEWTRQRPSWVTTARRVTIEVTAHETVTLALPVLHQMLTDLGYRQVIT